MKLSFRKFAWALLLTVSVSVSAWAQETGRVYGRVSDTSGRPLDLVNVMMLSNTATGTVTNEMGRYELEIPAQTDVVIRFSSMGYVVVDTTVRVMPGKRLQLVLHLVLNTRELGEYVFSEKYEMNDGVEHIDAKTITSIPTMSSGVEGLVKASGLGVHSSNELSAQYNVRGGSYDENLIYVNGTEVYRPFLIRSGQQEGLSFINSDMVSAVRFSSGGFESRYGDKMSSVLDVDYKEPDRFSGSLSASLLGASGHAGGLAAKGKLTYLVGARYQSNAYILKQMQTRGNYQPNFTDVQALLRYQPNEKWKLSLFGNFARNEYRLIPESGEATVGNILTTLQRLNIYYDGQEVDAYQTLFGSFQAGWQCSRFTEISFVGTYFRSMERETFDLNAEYWMSDINMNFGSDGFGESSSSRAVGGELHHGRNYLDADIFHAEVKGRHILGPHVLSWSVSGQEEEIHDRLNEWYLYDSCGYSLPHPYTQPGDSVSLSDDARILPSSDYLKVDNRVHNNRLNAYVQDKWEFGLEKLRHTLTAGVRAAYATYNGEFFLTPRVRWTATPMSRKNLSFYLAAGMYYQPTFYKEMRDVYGNLDASVRSQKSAHFIVGSDYLFHWGDSPFKLSGECYYKYLWDLISYEVDNVRILYSGANDADGYAYGADVKLSGEIVPGLESWLSFSFLKTMEDLRDDYYVRYYDSLGNRVRNAGSSVSCDTVYPGWIPRPTDQRFAVNLFFQDQIPKMPSLKVHINLIYSTPMPNGIVGTPKYTHTYRGKAYFRTDVGFSWRFLTGTASGQSVFSRLKSAYLTLEILNMFNYYNIISYTAVTDIDGNSYLTPNYLTPRLYNVKLRFEF